VVACLTLNSDKEGEKEEKEKTKKNFDIILPLFFCMFAQNDKKNAS
jgi:hypothetical protein